MIVVELGSGVVDAETVATVVEVDVDCCLS